MRIAIVGDLQYWEGESVEDIVNDLIPLNPDAVVILGDYGYWNGFGSCEVFSHINSEFSRIGCKIIPLVGNHDVQWEAGERKVKEGFVRDNYLKAFGDYPVTQIMDFENFRVICIHTEPQKKDDFYFEYECYISDRVYENVCEELEKYPHKPTVMITHAPPAGCNLLTVPLVHVRAGNAYLNQDHGYKKWTDLAKNNRQIVMWFSGHYHMGHTYEDSSSISDGIAYFITGSATSGCRDGLRHTRILDENNGIITVSTYDHDSKTIISNPDYVLNLSHKRPEYIESIKCVFSAGCGCVTSMKQGANGRVYAMTDNNILWEIDVTDRFCAGAIHYSDQYKLDSFEADSRFIWCICGDKAFGHRYSDANRFMREIDWENCVFEQKNADEIKRSNTEQYMYNGRIACVLDDKYVCSSFNREDGKLFFEVTEIK